MADLDTTAATRFPRTPSSTGLEPRTAGALAYLGGPLSGALILIVERSSRFVRFHAWQALLALGAVGVAALVCLGLAFLMLVVSPKGFWVLLWMAAGFGGCWIALWATCVVVAYRGHRWKLPVAGAFAERWAQRG